MLTQPEVKVPVIAPAGAPNDTVWGDGGKAEFRLPGCDPRVQVPPQTIPFYSGYTQVSIENRDDHVLSLLVVRIIGLTAADGCVEQNEVCRIHSNKEGGRLIQFFRPIKKNVFLFLLLCFDIFSLCFIDFTCPF